MLDISAINPYIRIAMHSVIPAGHEIKRRVIFDYEIIYIANGEFVLTYNGEDYRCEKGQFVLLRPGIPHSFSGIAQDLEQPHIHFDITHADDSTHVPVSFKDICDMTEKERACIRSDIFSEYPPQPFLTFSAKERITALFYEIVGDPDISFLMRKAKLIQIIEALIGDNFPNLLMESDPPYRVERHIKDYIDSKQGFAADLEDIAKQFNYNKYYLERCFKSSYGISIIAYRNEKRMLAARELLKNNTVSETSEKLGFSSIYVFSRAFKHYFGYSPSNEGKAE